MAITAKELAKLLNISEAAVSMALNNKPGISREKRAEIIELAKKMGYDFSHINSKSENGHIYFIKFSRYGTIVNENEIFNQITKIIQSTCTKEKIKLDIMIIDNIQELVRLLKTIHSESRTGVLLLATEMSETELKQIEHFSVPIVLMDCMYNSIQLNCVAMNNRQGAYIATQFLLNQFHTQPGYLHSSYNISNFRERNEGFRNAIHDAGLSVSQSIVHQLAPSLDGAYTDMLQIIKNGDKLARCYFADNDFIALGAMKAFKECGIRIPRDVAIIGFDNISLSSKSVPALSTINVKREHLAPIAIIRLIHQMDESIDNYIATTLINTTLVMRRSTDL